MTNDREAAGCGGLWNLLAKQICHLSFVICYKATSLRRARFSVAYENMDADFSCSGLGSLGVGGDRLASFLSR
jgi:hypothetical protein